jgi:hypothetical protein
MHRCLEIMEILNNIFCNSVSYHNLYALALVSRAFHEPALNFAVGVAKFDFASYKDISGGRMGRDGKSTDTGEFFLPFQIFGLSLCTSFSGGH